MVCETHEHDEQVVMIVLSKALPGTDIVTSQAGQLKRVCSPAVSAILWAGELLTVDWLWL